MTLQATAEPRPAASLPPLDLEGLRRRFEAKVERTDGCWLWRGYRNPKTGYGYLRRGKGRGLIGAHQVGHLLDHGPIPEGFEPDHRCEVRHCVRWHPEHIVLATRRENVHRSQSPWGINARKTACWLGHPFAGRNLVIDANGKRQCRECMNRRGRAFRAKRATPADAPGGAEGGA